MIAFILSFFISTAHASTGTDLATAENVAKEIKFGIVEENNQRYVWAKFVRINGNLVINTCLVMPWEAWSTVVISMGTVTLYDALNAPVPTAPMPWIWTNKMNPPESTPAWCL